MMKIMVVCAGGATSSFFKKRLEQEIKKKHLDWYITNKDAISGLSECMNYDIVIISPQLEFMYETFKKCIIGFNTSIIKINKNLYFGLDNEEIIPEIEKEVESIFHQSFKIAYIYKLKPNHMQSVFIQNIKDQANNRKLSIDINMYKYESLFDKEFHADTIIFDYSFYQVGNPTEGLITSKNIPFIFIHPNYYFSFETLSLILNNYYYQLEKCFKDSMNLNTNL